MPNIGVSTPQDKKEGCKTSGDGTLRVVVSSMKWPVIELFKTSSFLQNSDDLQVFELNGTTMRQNSELHKNESKVGNFDAARRMQLAGRYLRHKRLYDDGLALLAPTQGH
ncbi:hypothetical protein ElyMa_004656700 [Elysia marginata]|uniref:Uncharacterized protein n=1 Tax=Elysia marginata TaxID=1093978 RepID=A0AAV4I1W9_9GAST|nr:hypothetical protein ElyMa_004656700 [Elysia marginata]